jgi:diguanylate cyclase (GGDEF)-like protein
MMNWFPSSVPTLPENIMTKKKKYVLPIFLLLIVGFTILSCLLLYYRSTSIENEKKMARMDAKIYSDNIAKTMDSAEDVTKVLDYCLVGMNGDTGFFDGTAKVLYDKLNYVNSIQLAPGGVVSAIYPSAGNEKGYIDLMNDEERGPIVKYGMIHHVITAQGPFDLKQGGMGIAIRDPVYLSDGSFWGFTIAIVDVNQLTDATITKIKASNYDFRLEKTESIKNEMFLPVAESGKLEDPVTVTFDSGASKWRLSIEPKTGWFRSADFLLILLLGTAIVILITWLFYMLILNHERQDRLQKAAGIDFLTGVRNRQGIDDEVSLYFRRNVDQPFVAIMMDIDYFKIINDCYGHLTGDEALKALARTLKEIFPEDAIIGRYGGDEFFVLLKGRTPDQAKPLLQKLMDTEIRYKTGEETYDVISISVGYAYYSGDSKDPEEVIRLADQALYKSKEHGKGRYEGYEEDS